METRNRLIIKEIRSYNRFYTDILGLLNKHILDSQYSLTEARVLFEIGKTKNCTANMLMDKLNTDRGYMSRILKGFETDGLINRENSTADGRVFFLNLTPRGKEILLSLKEKSSEQVQRLIEHLTDNEQERLVESMRYIRRALLSGISPAVIRSYQTEDLKYLIDRHKELYKIEYGFGPEFVDYVEKYVLEFHEGRDRDKENIWIAEVDTKPAGTIAIVKADDSTAQLRWFLIEPEMRGRKLGHQMMETVIEFCKEKHYKHIMLWTVSMLDAARHLYQEYGFTLTETKENNSWADNLTEERWELDLQE